MTDPYTSLAGLKRGLLSDQIYELMKSMIKDGSLPPGEQLVESQLAKRMQVSQAPVREALKQLAHEGLVSHVRRLMSSARAMCASKGLVSHVRTGRRGESSAQ